jgi:DNA-directed RNA polymerase specialized sigma24 family protein
MTDDLILSYARRLLDYLPHLHFRLPLNTHDWDDIKADILLRVHTKRHLLKADQPFKPYVKTIIGRSFQNQIRDRCRRKGYPVRNAAHLDDVVQPTCNLPHQARELADSLITRLPEADQILLRQYERDGRWAHESLGSRVYQRRYKQGIRAIKTIQAMLVEEGS